jgi:hypothetical protein
VKKVLIRHIILVSLSMFFAISTYGMVESSVINVYAMTLLAVSVAVFTLAGIWVAYIYPKAIGIFTDPSQVDFFDAKELTVGVEKLVLIMIVSSFSIGSVLAIGFSTFLYNLMLGVFPIIAKSSNFGLACSVFILVYCSFIQFSAIFKVIIRNFRSVESLHKLKMKREIKEKS